MYELIMYYDLKTERDLGLQLVDISNADWDDVIKDLLADRGIGYYVYYN